MFNKHQPDLNWRNPDVRSAMLDIFRYWLDKGVDGFRLDVFNAWYKEANLRDNPGCLAFTADLSRAMIIFTTSPSLK